MRGQKVDRSDAGPMGRSTLTFSTSSEDFSSLAGTKQFPSPSMRRPVRVKTFLFLLLRILCLRAASVAILHPQSVMSDFSLAARWAYSILSSVCTRPYGLCPLRPSLWPICNPCTAVAIGCGSNCLGKPEVKVTGSRRNAMHWRNTGPLAEG